jgi:hypothetical protein
MRSLITLRVAIAALFEKFIVRFLFLVAGSLEPMNPVYRNLTLMQGVNTKKVKKIYTRRFFGVPFSKTTRG